MAKTRSYVAATLILGLVGLAACSQPSMDVVVGACVRDGQPLDYCECIDKGMRHSLEDRDYDIFTRFMTLGGIDTAGPEDILKVMEEFELSPGALAELRGRIGTLTAQVHTQCTT